MRRLSFIQHKCYADATKPTSFYQNAVQDSHHKYYLTCVGIAISLAPFQTAWFQVWVSLRDEVEIFSRLLDFVLIDAIINIVLGCNVSILRR